MLVQRFAKFAVIGLIGVGLNVVLFWILSDALQLHYLLAGAVAIEMALCSNYLFNTNWTFRDRSAGSVSTQRFTRYHAVSFGGMAINLGTLHLLAAVAGIPPTLANLVGIGIASGWNFSLHLLWTWRRAEVGT